MRLQELVELLLLILVKLAAIVRDQLLNDLHIRMVNVAMLHLSDFQVVLLTALMRLPEHLDQAVLK